VKVLIYYTFQIPPKYKKALFPINMKLIYLKYQKPNILLYSP